MAASTTDRLHKIGAATKTTLAAPGKALAATSINVVSTTNWPTDTQVTFAIRKIQLEDGEWKEVAGSYAEFNGIVSGTTITNMGTPVYGSDQVYPAGTTTEVFIPVSAYAHNRMIDGILVGHNQTGTHKVFTESAIVPTAAIQDSAVTSAKIADNGITAAKLATDAISLGSGTVTATLSTASTTPVQAAGLTVTATVPAGGRKVEVKFFGSQVNNSTTSSNYITLWEGAVGSGTEIARGRITIPATYGQSMTLTTNPTYTPSAGSKTWNVGFHTNSGIMYIEPAVGAPGGAIHSWIEVKAK